MDFPLANHFMAYTNELTSESTWLTLTDCDVRMFVCLLDFHFQTKFQHQK